MLSRVAIRDLKHGVLSDLKKEALYFDWFLFDTDSYRLTQQVIYGLVHSIERQHGGAIDRKALFSEAEATVDFLVRENVLVPINIASTISRYFDLKTVDKNGTPSMIFLPKSPPAFDANIDYMKTMAPLLGHEINRIAAADTKPTTPKMIHSNDFGSFLNGITAENARRAKLLAMMHNWLDPNACYVPILDEYNLISDNKLVREQETTKVILKKFPIPDEDVPWQQILEFRSNQTHRSQLMTLRRWVAQIATQDKNRRELEEEIEFLLHEFSRLMDIQRIKYKYSTFAILVTTPLEILENLVRIKWSDAAKNIFDIRRQKIDFQLATESLPGKELAYIHSARKTFGGSD